MTLLRCELHLYNVIDTIDRYHCRLHPHQPMVSGLTSVGSMALNVV